MNRLSQKILDFNPGVAVSTVLFLLVLLVVYVFLGIFEMLSLPPAGIHFIRQTDSQAFVFHYFLYEPGFFNPGIFALEGQGGRAAGEFPLVYYLTAQIFKLTGPGFTLARGIGLLLSSLGIVYTFLLFRHFLLSFVKSVVACLLVFSSTVFLYYAISYIPDPMALGLLMPAWYYFILAYEKDKTSFWVISALFFTLASLTKISFFISVIAILVHFAWFRRKKEPKALRKKIYIFFVCTLLPQLAWVLYVYWYNSNFESYYFLTSVNPFWVLAKEEIVTTLEYVSAYWQFAYFYPLTWLFWALALLFVGIYIRRTGNIANLWFTLLLGCLALLVLFFRSYKDHDYYFIVWYPFFIFLALAFFIRLKSMQLLPVFRLGIYALLAGVVFLALRNNRIKLGERLSERDQFNRIAVTLKDYHLVLDSLGIEKDAEFAVSGDYTINGSLLFMRRKGFCFGDTLEEKKGMVKFVENHHPRYVLELYGKGMPQELEGQYQHPVLDRDSVRIYRREDRGSS